MGPGRRIEHREMAYPRPRGGGTCLVKDATIVGGDIVSVEEETLLHWKVSVISGMAARWARRLSYIA